MRMGIKYQTFNRFVSICGLILITMTGHANAVLYVASDSACESNCGDSWANACQDFACIEQYLTNSGYYTQQVWVKKGTYIFSSQVSINCQSSGKLEFYGGFDGTETALAQRDWENNVTILSGDINDDDTKGVDNYVTNYSNISGDNAPSLLSIQYSPDFVIDGFVITAVKTKFNSPYASRAITFNTVSTNLLIKNLLFAGNDFLEKGASLEIYSCQNVYMDNLTFKGNRGSTYSISYINTSTNVYMRNSLFLNNTAVYGGALRFSNSSAMLGNVTFKENLAEQNGGAIYLMSTDLNMANVIITGNKANQGAAIYNFSDNNLFISQSTIASNNTLDYTNSSAVHSNNITCQNSIVWGNNAQQLYGAQNISIDNAVVQNWTGSGTNVFTISPNFVNCPDASTAPTSNGDFFISTPSSAMNAGINNNLPQDVWDLDDDTTMAEPLPFDYSGNQRIQQTYVDLGAFETTENPPSEIDIQRPVNTSIGSQRTDQVPDVQLGQSNLSYIIDNTAGTGPLVIDSIQISNLNNADNISYTAPSIVYMGLTDTLDLTFTTLSSGRFSYSVTIQSNDADESNYTFLIEGTAIGDTALTVCNSGGFEYTSIINAINDAKDGTIIAIQGGTYNEGTLNVSKEITLTTQGHTDAVTIVTDNLTIGVTGTVLLNGQTSVIISQNLTNLGSIRYLNCASNPSIQFVGSNHSTITSNHARNSVGLKPMAARLILIS